MFLQIHCHLANQLIWCWKNHTVIAHIGTQLINNARMRITYIAIFTTHFSLLYTNFILKKIQNKKGSKLMYETLCTHLHLK